MELTRRTFIQGTATLAAGAAVGMGASMAFKGVREHGPVEIWAYFLSKDPIVISKCTLFADEHRDVFGLRVLDKDGKGIGTLEMPLSSMRKAVQSESREKVTCLVTSPEKKESFPLSVISEQGKVSFMVGDTGPAWMILDEVQRVL